MVNACLVAAIERALCFCRTYSCIDLVILRFSLHIKDTSAVIFCCFAFSLRLTISRFSFCLVSQCHEASHHQTSHRQ